MSFDGLIHPITNKEASALAWCLAYHGRQEDKSGKPYVLHPIRVAWSVWNGSEDVMIAALLHDLVEDCGVTLNAIECVFGKCAAEAVDALSRRKGETYFDFIRRCKQNPIARRVKLADIADNTRPERIEGLPEAERGIVKRYAKAKAMLESEDKL